MKKVKLSFKQKEFNQDIESHSILLPFFNEVFQSYQAMKLPELTLNEFRELINKPEAVVFEKMTQGKVMEMNGFKIASEKAFNMIEKPEGYEKLIASINAVKAGLNFDWFLNNVSIENGEVILNSELINQITERNTVYARTEQQLKAYEFTKTVIEKAVECFGDGTQDISFLLAGFIYPLNHAALNREYRMNFEKILAFLEPM